jgi:uncharacterized coiled-coil DUF342 family protein
MTSDKLFNSEIEPSNRHFEIAQSEEDDEDQSISLSPTSSMDDHQLSAINKVETFNDKKLNKLYDEWLAVDAELRAFEPKHKEYVSKLDDVESLKTKYRNEFDKYKKKIDTLQKDVARLRKSHIKKG